MRPIACLITDRSRLRDATADGLVEQARQAAAGGVQLIQLRERDLDARALFDLACRMLAAVHGTATRILVNDRLDVALAADAHGVHLRSSSFAASRVRAVVPTGFLVGRSVHSAHEASTPDTAGADYLLFGNVFETASKPGAPAKGIAALTEIVRATPLPVLALGGITRADVPQLLDAGAAGYAGISLFAGDSIQ